MASSSSSRWYSYLSLLTASVAYTSIPKSIAFTTPPLSTTRWRYTCPSWLVAAATHDTSSIITTDSTPPTTLTEDPYQVLSEGSDPAIDAPLPKSFTECPFSGILSGPQSFYRQASAKLQSPSLFSFLYKNQPMVEVRGGTWVRKILNQEFSSLSSNAVVGLSQIVCGKETLRTVTDPREHKRQRELMSGPLSASNVANSIPRLEQIATAWISSLSSSEHPNRIRSGTRLVAYDFMQNMALDVTWKLLLGLKFDTEEATKQFREQTAIWLRGIYHKVGTPEMDATLEAKKYLVQLIENRIDSLLQAGVSDGSTLGGLVFARLDDKNGDKNFDNNHNNDTQSATLTRQQIIDNALFLILAGTETTSSTLANIMLLAGLNPHMWQKAVQEQAQIVETYGPTLTPELVLPDMEKPAMPYLEALILETMRILPLTLVSRRVTTKTMVVDGKQIPPGWGVSYNIYLTHQNDENLKDDDNGGDCMNLRTGFRPDRWLDPKTKPPRTNYIPFGAGPRHCPGSLLAMTEQKVFLAMLARGMPQFELDLKEEIDPTKSIEEQIDWNPLSAVHTPADGVPIQIL